MENVTFGSEPTNYASFGRRFVALLIDGLILGVAQSIVIAPIMVAIGLGAVSNADALSDMNEQQAMGMASGILGATMAIQLVSFIIGGVYFVLMESSAKQGTLGKMAMGLKVTDLNGNRINTTAAVIRYIGRLVSGAILLIGYIMAAFTAKKQALHDLMASTLVLKP
ncbi:MAG: RDD family protein [Spirosomataceae bacterium]